MKKLISSFVIGLSTLGLSVFLFSNTVDAATKKGWYEPIPWNNAISCKKCVLYGPDTLKNGTCKVDWNGVISNTTNNIIGSLTGGTASPHK